MNRLGKYRGTDSMSNLICENYRTLSVMSRFGIRLGFGDKSIEEVCRENGVDTATFLTVINMRLDDDAPVDRDEVSVESLIGYLHNSHDYFLEYRLPAIRHELVAAVGLESSLSRAVISFFDEYIAEVQQHMAYEETVVFPYVRSLIENSHGGEYNIEVFRRKHDQVEARLIEFKNIFIKYYPAESTNEINNILFDIFSCERDLASHNATEDRLLIPAIRKLEKEKRHKAK